MPQTLPTPPQSLQMTLRKRLSSAQAKAVHKVADFLHMSKLTSPRGTKRPANASPESEDSAPPPHKRIEKAKNGVRNSLSTFGSKTRHREPAVELPADNATTAEHIKPTTTRDEDRIHAETTVSAGERSRPDDAIKVLHDSPAATPDGVTVRAVGLSEDEVRLVIPPRSSSKVALQNTEPECAYSEHADGIFDHQLINGHEEKVAHDATPHTLREGSPAGMDAIGVKKLEEHIKGHKAKPSEDSGYQSTRKVTPPQEENEAMKIVEENAEEQEELASSSGSGKQSVATPPSTPTPPSPALSFGKLDSKKHRPLCVSREGPPKDPLARQEGILGWERDPFGTWLPQWEMEPDLGLIKETVSPYGCLCGFSSEDITVQFLTEGLWNKVYTVSCPDHAAGTVQQCILRLALPVDPWHKVQSEVATMEYVRMQTSVPVPKVYAFDSSANNKLRLEWILMEKIQGKPYKEVEDVLDFDTREQLHKTAADWVDQLSKLRFDKIGSLYCRWDQPSYDLTAFILGPVVHAEFYPDFRLQYGVFRGPFRSLADFYRSIIRVYELEAQDQRQKDRALYWETHTEGEEGRTESKQDKAVNGERQLERCNGISSNETDGDVGDLCMQDGEEVDQPMESLYSVEDLERIPKYLGRLRETIPLLDSDELLGPARTFLNHWDLSKENIMVDDAGKPIALLDWEQITASSVAMATAFPRLVETNGFTEPPAWPADKPKDEDQLWQEKLWDQVLLKRVFEARLRELSSPVLRAVDECDDDLDSLWRHVTDMDYHKFPNWTERIHEEKRWRLEGVQEA
ncbi:hypothetical protein H2201_004577 [Coniosporium apollinis]|uniref:Aminoglycoside phosphotransferase domain-containing protein n=1 Tax=Coniosporium apollinis TaxID=61459 RepID=A0ABQ9NSB6_9PEZI|nr:hypothetical protein H2201_004577 [Coniosporium apollinis]